MEWMKCGPKWPFQEEARLFMYPRKRVGCAAYYGAGKTWMVLDWLAHWAKQGADCFPVVIWGKISWLHQWYCRTIEFTHFSCVEVTGTAQKRVKLLDETQAHIYLVNYDAVKSPPVLAALKRKKFRTTISDESQLLKEKRTERWELLYHSIAKHCEWRAALSGRPAPEDGMDWWAQTYYLDDGALLSRSFWKCRDTYFQPGPPWAPYDWRYKANGHEALAKRLSSLWFVIPQEVVQKSLPPRQFIRVPFVLPDKYRKMYRSLAKEFMLSTDLHSFETQWAVVKTVKMQQLLQGFINFEGEIERFHTIKEQWIEENLPSMLETGGSTLIWSAHKPQVYSIEEVLKKLRVPYAVHTGDQPKQVRDQVQIDFQEKRLRVLLLSIQSGYQALDLWRANYCICASLVPNADMYYNMLERCYRGGSEIHSQINYYLLLFEKTLDEVLVKALADKRDVAQMILDHITAVGVD